MYDTQTINPHYGGWMRNLSIIVLLAVVSINLWAKPVTILVGSDTLESLRKIDNQLSVVEAKKDVVIINFAQEKLGQLSILMHQKFSRCPGFTRFESNAEALEELSRLKINRSIKGIFNLDYSISHQNLVQPLIAQVDEVNLVKIIAKLSSFKSRYHKTATAQEAVNWLKEYWESLSQRRSDIKVELFKHKRSPMPSVILTIEGSENPDEIVVVGGHLDSIARNFFGMLSKEAPGADDNASGISTMTEVIRILVENDYRPKKTVKFMAYAAEEIGLVGSKEIANAYRDQHKNVIGVMQLDMTNFKGSDEDIVFMTDYTNKAQNTFMQKLIDTYVKVKWGTDRCGYGCSDHASWTNAGFPASVPFESMVHDMNHKIHSTKDTLAVSNNHAYHAVPFTKLAVAFVIELAH